MKSTFKVRYLLKDTNAISEEFTVLPALSIVMIGFVIFVVLLAQTYTAYAAHMNYLQNYQTAESILHKLTNPDCYFITKGGLINVGLLQENIKPLEGICTQYQKLHINFFLRLQWNNFTQDFPESSKNPINCIALSKTVGIYLNEAHTVPGILTILFWEES